MARRLVLTTLLCIVPLACADDASSDADDGGLQPAERIDQPTGSDDDGFDDEPDGDADTDGDSGFDGECTAEELGEDDTTEFVVAHIVDDGELGAVCFGTEDDDVLRAWDALATITPPGQLVDLALFAGFVAPSDADPDAEVTLAFVNAVDTSGETFQMSINLDELVEDEDTALLTLAHEFSHVFTATPPQLDRSDEAFDDCDTYLTSDGCYTPDSLMYQWIETFWGEWIDEIDPNDEATVAAGEERCQLDPSFFGSYGASNPEEDFAEAFSAYVFDVEAASDAQQDKLDWIDDQPGLAEFRDRAEAAGWTPLPHTFEPCGG